MDAAKLDSIAGLVDEIDAAGPATPEQQAEAQAVDAMEASAREWGAIAYTVGGALAMLAPELRQVYTEDACMGWGRAAATVAEKHGWTGPGSMPEVGLALATAGLAIPSYLAIRVRLEQLRKARPPEPVDAAPVSPHEAIHGTPPGGDGGS